MIPVRSIGNRSDQSWPINPFLFLQTRLSGDIPASIIKRIAAGTRRLEELLRFQGESFSRIQSEVS